MGDIAFDVDGEPVDFANTFTYRGIMNSGIPNMSFMFGYFRTSWTMRIDLVSDVVCRLLHPGRHYQINYPYRSSPRAQLAWKP